MSGRDLSAEVGFGPQQGAPPAAPQDLSAQVGYGAQPTGNSGQLPVQGNGVPNPQPAAKTSAFMGGVAGFDNTIDRQVQGLGQLALEGAVKAGIASPTTLDKYNNAVQGIQQQRQDAMAGHPIASTVGSLAAYGAEGAALPGAAMTAGGRMGLAAAQQGALGAASYVGPDDSRLANAGLGAAGGVLSQGVGEVLGKGLQAIGGPNLNKLPTDAEAKSLGADAKDTVLKSMNILDTISGTQSKMAAGQMAQNSLVKYQDVLEKNFQDLYKQAGTAAGKDLQITDPQLGSDVAGIVKDYESKVPPEIIKQLHDFKPFSTDPNATPLTVDSASMLAKKLNERWAQSDDPAEKAALSKIRQTIYTHLDAVGTQSPAAKLFLAARDGRVAYEKVFGQDDLVNKIVTEKADGVMKLQPENIVNSVMQGKAPVTNINIIKKALTTTGAPEDQAAWDAIQRTGLQDKLFKGAIQLDEQGGIDPSQPFNYKAYAKNYDNMGHDVVQAIAGDPKLGGKLQLLRAASKYNAQAANSVWNNTVKPTIQSYIGKAALVGGGYVGINHLKDTLSQ